VVDAVKDKLKEVEANANSLQEEIETLYKNEVIRKPKTRSLARLG